MVCTIQKLANLRVCSLNVGTIRGSLKEIAKILARGSVVICCLQKTIFKGRSVGMAGN